MKLKKLLPSLGISAATFFWRNFPVSANIWDDMFDDLNPGGPSDLAEWIPQVLNLAIGLAALVCVAVLIGSGYMYITAAGDETKVEKATKSLTYAIIGLVICFISVILVQFVLRNVLGAGTN